MDCEHKWAYSMHWPDGGTSELCSNCLMTRHIDDVITTEWQDHGYKAISDWYYEAAELQCNMNHLMPRPHKPYKVTVPEFAMIIQANGINYSSEIFKFFADYAKNGTIFKFIKSEDGTVTIENITKSQNEQAAAEADSDIVGAL